MAGWSDKNNLYLTGDITTGLTLSINNADAGTVPVGMTVNTYDDGTYDDENYAITAVFEGLYESQYNVHILSWLSTGDTNDIKYQVNPSSDGISFDGWTSEVDAINNVQVKIEKKYAKIRFIFYSPNWSDTDDITFVSSDRAFTYFANGEIVDADKFTTNYKVVGSGDLLPRGGASLFPTTSVYNLGSDGFRWNEVHSYIIDTADEIGGTFNLVSSVLISTSSDRIEFSGLIDNNYYLTVKFLNDSTSSDETLLFFNGDSATNYGYQTMYDTTGALVGTTAGIYIGACGSSGSYAGVFEGFIDCQPSHPKMIAGSGHNADIERYFTVGGVWNNTSDTVTSMILYNASKFNTGSEVKLWTKK